MDEKNWPLTRRAIEDSERAAGLSEADLTDETEPERGNSLMRELAAEGDRLGWVDSGSGPGFMSPLPKLRPDRDKLS